MKKFLLFALTISLAGCASEPATKTAPAAPVLKVAHAMAPSSGYVKAGNTVTFVLDPGNLRAVTDTSAGKMLDLKTLKVTSVSVAGAFNKWDLAANPLALKGGLWSATVDAAKLGTTPSPFKFVVNGTYWVEPTLGATNTIDNGMGSGAKNYMFEP